MYLCNECDIRYTLHPPSVSLHYTRFQRNYIQHCVDIEKWSIGIKYAKFRATNHPIGFDGGNLGPYITAAAFHIYTALILGAQKMISTSGSVRSVGKIESGLSEIE